MTRYEAIQRSDWFQVASGRNPIRLMDARLLSVLRWFSIEYATFKVDSPSNNFALRVSNSGIGDAGDALNYDDLVGTKINGMPFSTSDRQNDRCQCSSYYGGGWWFNCCMYGHLNGDSSRGYFYWHPLSELGLSPTPVLQISRMMISSVWIRIQRACLSACPGCWSIAEADTNSLDLLEL